MVFPSPQGLQDIRIKPAADPTEAGEDQGTQTLVSHQLLLKKLNICRRSPLIKEVLQDLYLLPLTVKLVFMHYFSNFR
jgi:hypothetical protein